MRVGLIVTACLLAFGACLAARVAHWPLAIFLLLLGIFCDQMAGNVEDDE